MAAAPADQDHAAGGTRRAPAASPPRPGPGAGRAPRQPRRRWRRQGQGGAARPAAASRTVNPSAPGPRLQAGVAAGLVASPNSASIPATPSRQRRASGQRDPAPRICCCSVEQGCDSSRSLPTEGPGRPKGAFQVRDPSAWLTACRGIAVATTVRTCQVVQEDTCLPVGWLRLHKRGQGGPALLGPHPEQVLLSPTCLAGRPHGYLVSRWRRFRCDRRATPSAEPRTRPAARPQRGVPARSGTRYRPVPLLSPRLPWLACASTRPHRARGALVPPLRAVVARPRGTAHRTRDPGRPRHHHR
jgi:hypothetical protein